MRAAIILTAACLGAASMAGGGEGSGRFAGQSGHEVSGSATVVRTVDGWEVRLGEDFRFDGAPDPRIGFGQRGRFAAGTDFEPLAADAGAQVYPVPAGIDPQGFDTVFIWCREFAVPLGLAAIE